MKKYNFIVIFIYSCCLSLNAQKQNSNWYFGNKSAISFSNGNPTSLNTSQMVSVEGCASVSDPVTGKLLFYTNGIEIWNANNTIMPNGSGLLSGGSTSASQGVLIAPCPGKTKWYYVFTVDETGNNGANGFRYSIVDMNLNNGLGDVISQQKNSIIQTNTTERIAITKNDFGTGYWLVIHERNNNCFKVYAVNANGVSSTPVISNIGSIHSTAPQANGDATMGHMKFSHDGKKIAVALYASNKIELFDFDKCTGKLSNFKTISTIDNPYGIEFSPDNSQLYYSMYDNAGFTGAIYQLNLLSANPSPVLIGISSSLNNQCVGALQLAPNNKIYVAVNSESWLSAISQPDSSGIACGFIDKAIFLPKVGLFPTTGILGLPPLVLEQTTNTPYPPAILARDFCFADSTRFELSSNKNVKSVLWNFGLSNLPNNTSTLFNPALIYPDTGLFTVSAIVNSGCKSDTVSVKINIAICDSSNTPCFVHVPDAFTPNNDGVNDKFSPIFTCQTSFFEMSVYNRWRGLVWHTTDRNDQWDGRYNGKECSDGVYIYILKAGSSANIISYKGTLTLLR